MTYHSRSDWGARSSRNRSTIRPRGVAVHYNGPPLGAYTHDRCAGIVRGIQAMHMDSPERKWADIAYNMLVCRHGDIYEGRGKDVRSAGNGTDYGNANYVCVMGMMGDGDDLTNAMKAGIVEAAGLLGQAGGEWKVHQDFFNTSCPGSALLQWVRSGHTATPKPPKPEPKPDQEEDDMAKMFIAPDPTNRHLYLYDTNTRTRHHVTTVQQGADLIYLGQATNVGPDGAGIGPIRDALFALYDEAGKADKGPELSDASQELEAECSARGLK